MRILIPLVALIWLSPSLSAELPLGQPAPQVELSGDLGERVSGGDWNSSELTGVVHVLFYVDPDEGELNNSASEALKDAKFVEEKFRSVAIINMDATWMPNALIQIKLEKKQEDYPRTIYVRDYDKVLVKKWGLADDSSDIVVFDREGTVVFSVDGKLSDVQIEQMLKVTRDNL